jgi:MarR family 2-MHQ and catechol resistance regulon transcriptional repressor
MPIHYKGTAAEVRALSAFVKLMRSAGMLQSCLEAGIRKTGLTESQLGVLEMLLHLGPLHQHRIGEKMLLSRANITILVDQLSKRGLVRRVRDTEDRRRVAVHLTAEGRRRIERVFPSHVERIVELFSALEPREQEQLARLCRKLGLAARELRQG